MTSKILATSVLALVFAGCATGGSNDTSGSTPAPRIPTAGAVRVAGDLVPGRLVSVSIPAPTEVETVGGSGALAPKKGFALEQPALAVTAHDVHRVMQGDPASFTIMVDHPDGARVLVHPLDPSMAMPTVHLVEVATGNRLDAARDGTNQVNVSHVAHPAVDDEPAALGDARGLPMEHPTGPVAREAREPAFAASLSHLRRLSFDRPFTSGLVRVEVPAAMAAAGIFVELQQPKSHITASVIADQANHSFGDTAEIVATLMNDSTPIREGTVEGTVELPGHTKLPILSFTSRGDGTWVAHLPLSSTDPTYVGVWGLEVRATGAVNGVGFERDVETAIGYYPAHSQITALGTPVIARGADKLIDSISVDADIQTLVDDRFSVRGTLTYTAADGTEHPLAEAQTGKLVHAGTGTITLTFDNASLALAGVDGPFHLRDVALVSQGYGHTQHRIGRALDIQTPHIAATEIRYPAKIPMQAEDLIANGDLPRRIKL